MVNTNVIIRTRTLWFIPNINFPRGIKMPACGKCSRWVDGVCTSRPWGDKPINQLRGCAAAIYEDFLHTLNPGQMVLEVGVGKWSAGCDFCREIGIVWVGLDILQDSLASLIGSIGSLPFSDNAFDIIMGQHTIEHWRENGCRLESGLYECFRVLKPGGRLFFTAPLYLHGSREFVRGRVQNIAAIFKAFTNKVDTELWGNGVQLLNYPPLKNSPAMNVVIQAWKTRAPGAKPRPYFFKRRLIREILDHSPFFVAWKVKEKLLKKWRDKRTAL